MQILARGEVASIAESAVQNGNNKNTCDIFILLI
jgi:hypothetical protein